MSFGTRRREARVRRPGRRRGRAGLSAVRLANALPVLLFYCRAELIRIQAALITPKEWVRFPPAQPTRHPNAPEKRSDIGKSRRKARWAGPQYRGSRSTPSVQVVRARPESRDEWRAQSLLRKLLLSVPPPDIIPLTFELRSPNLRAGGARGQRVGLSGLIPDLKVALDGYTTGPSPQVRNLSPVGSQGRRGCCFLAPVC